MKELLPFRELLRISGSSIANHGECDSLEQCWLNSDSLGDMIWLASKIGIEKSRLDLVMCDIFDYCIQFLSALEKIDAKNASEVVRSFLTERSFERADLLAKMGSRLMDQIDGDLYEYLYFFIVGTVFFGDHTNTCHALMDVLLLRTRNFDDIEVQLCDLVGEKIPFEELREAYWNLFEREEK